MGCGHPERWCVALPSTTYAIVHCPQHADTEAGEHMYTDSCSCPSYTCHVCACIFKPSHVLNQILCPLESSLKTSDEKVLGFLGCFIFFILFCFNFCYTGNFQVPFAFHSCIKHEYHLLEGGGQTAEGWTQPSVTQPSPKTEASTQQLSHVLQAGIDNERTVDGQNTSTTQKCQWKDSQWLCFKASNHWNLWT